MEAMLASANKPTVVAPKPSVQPERNSDVQRDNSSLPLLKAPDKISLTQPTTIPLVVGDKVAGTVKLPIGKTVTVKEADQTNVIADIDGQLAQIPKDSTDFQARLDAANAEIQKTNELRHQEQVALHKKQEEKEVAKTQRREQLMLFKHSMLVKVSDITKDGMFGATQTNVKVLISGADSKNIVPGEVWTGDAFPLGVFAKPDGSRFRRYTTNFAEFEAFKSREEAETAKN